MEFWSGYKPCTVVQLINRTLASVGSPQLAMQSEHANFNGHSVTMSFNERRRYWIAEYCWAGRQVIARGDFSDVLRACLMYQMNNGATGCFTVYCQTNEQADLCKQAGLAESSTEIKNKAFNELMPEWVMNEAINLAHLSKFKAVNYSILIEAAKNGLTKSEYNNELKGSN